MPTLAFSCPSPQRARPCIALRYPQSDSEFPQNSLSFNRFNHFRNQFGHLHILNRLADFEKQVRIGVRMTSRARVAGGRWATYHPTRVKDSKPGAGVCSGQETVRRVAGKEKLAQLDRRLCACRVVTPTCTQPISAMRA